MLQTVKLLLALLVPLCAAAQVIVVYNPTVGCCGNIQFAPGSILTVVPFGTTLSSNPAGFGAQIVPLGGSPIPLPILSIDSDSVVTLIPRSVPLGPAEVQAFFEGASVGAEDVTIVPTRFGLFLDGIVARAQNIAPDGMAESNSLTHPARPNGLLTLSGTGLGTATASAVSVLIGGRPTLVTYAGPQGSSPGVDQINVRIPDDPTIPDGCYIAVEVIVAGAPSGYATISYGRGSAETCQHPLGLSLTQIQTLDRGGTVRVASAGARSSNSSYSTFYDRHDFAYLEFDTLDARSAAYFSQPAQMADSSFLGCTGTDFFKGYLGGTAFAASPGVPTRTLVHQGDFLTLTGPDGRALQVRIGSNGGGGIDTDAPPDADSLDALPDSFFIPGTWKLDRMAGRGVTPFTVSFGMPPVIHVTNAPALDTLDHLHDVTVQWNPTGLAENQVVSVMLIPLDFDSPVPFWCIVPARSGSVTIPAALLPQPSATPDPTARPILYVDLTTRKGFLSPLQIQLGGEVISGGFNPDSTEEIPVTIQ
jgi:uncharacterized protein (TIGR03437 family)